MSSQPNDQIRAALDRVRVAVTGQLEADLTASASDILRAVDDAQQQAVVTATERAVADARDEAERQLQGLREEFDRQRDALEQRVAFETAALERELRDARDELAAARRELEEGSREREQIAQQLEQTRQEEEQGRRAVENAHAEIAAARHEVEELRQAIEGHTRALHDARRKTLEDGNQGVRGRLAQAERLAAGLCTLNNAASLSDVLDGLARAACQETGRSAVFLVRDSQLRGWRAMGFDGVDPAPLAGEKLAECALIDEALRSGAGQFSADDANDAVLPVFARGSGARDAVAVPIEVGGSVIAVLYVDAARTDRPEEREWLQTIEPMAKHAGRMLEAMTLRQAAALWTPRPAARRLPAGGHLASGSIGLS